MNPITFSKLVTQTTPEREIPLKASLLPKNLSTYQGPLGSPKEAAKEMKTRLQQQMTREIYQATPEIMTKLQKVNQKLASQGKKPIDLLSTTEQIENIMKGSSSAKEKQQKIDALRKQLGLSKGEIKKLFTKRLAKIYQNAEKTLKEFRQSQLSSLQQQIALAENQYGKNSSQVTELKRQSSEFKQTLDPRIRSLAEQGRSYNKLFPGFWSRLGGVFKKIGSGILKGISLVKNFVGFIPGIGPIARLAIGGVETIVELAKGKAKKALQIGLDLFKNFIPLPGLFGK